MRETKRHKAGGEKEIRIDIDGARKRKRAR